MNWTGDSETLVSQTTERFADCLIGPNNMITSLLCEQTRVKRIFTAAGEFHVFVFHALFEADRSKGKTTNTTTNVFRK